MLHAATQDRVKQHPGQVWIAGGFQGPKAGQILPPAGRRLGSGLPGEQGLRKNLAKVPGGVCGSGSQGL